MYTKKEFREMIVNSDIPLDNLILVFANDIYSECT